MDRRTLPVTAAGLLAVLALGGCTANSPAEFDRNHLGEEWVGVGPDGKKE